jgi:flagellar basal body-associated protein FliL
MGQQQVQQPGTSREQKQKRKGFSRGQRLIATIIAALIVALVIATAQVLSGAKIIPDIWATISNAIVGTFGMIFTFFALIPLLFHSDDPQPVPATATQVPAVASLQPIIIQLQQPASPHRHGVQHWIDDLRNKVGEEQYTAQLTQVEPQASQIIERALHEGL